ncbi:MAG: MBOAT family protein [Ruminococcus sp.]|nr:MBOAT family protein [Ruminococcus sp.]
MSLNSFHFVAFFLVVYIVNSLYGYITKGKPKSYSIYKLLILLESYAFIIISDIKTSLSLLALTIVSYLVVLMIKRNHNSIKIAKTALIIGIVIAVGQLCWFKYYDFLCGSIYSIFGLKYVAKTSFIHLGISFFTFSAISYMVDSYRDKCENYTNIFDTAVYLSFFPKFLSGPIVKPDKFMTEMKQSATRINLVNLQSGIQMVAVGFFKKMVVADHLAIFVDDVFLTPSCFSSATCFWAIISYSLQIYFDFSGYSDIAIGIAKMLGFDFDLNFNLPYIAKNVTEFWKRWHISLSTWLMEYVYFTLGGNRKGKIRSYINLLLTMLIGGLWHGAAWTFIIWGGIHGIALVIHKKYMQIRKTKGNYPGGFAWSNFISPLLTFVFVSIAWVFFRASSTSNALTILKRAVIFDSGVSQIFTWTWLAIFVVAIEVAVATIKKRKCGENALTIVYPKLNLSKVAGLIVFFTFIGLIIVLAYVGDTAFIYGKF